MEAINAYPLTWPAGWKRTAPGARKHSRFSAKQTITNQVGGHVNTYQRSKPLSVAESVDRLLTEIGRIGGSNAVVSTNIEVKARDGLPRSGQKEPDDPGVAVYFRLRKKDRCLACDTYTTVAGNIAALAAHISAIRAMERYGVGNIEQAFAGYTALPPNPEIDWRVMFGFTPSEPVTEEILSRAYRTLAIRAHPDSGGSHDAMARLNTAKDAALREIREMQPV